MARLRADSARPGARETAGSGPALKLHLLVFGLYACFACWSTLTFQGAALPGDPGGMRLAQVARASYMVTLALAALLLGCWPTHGDRRKRAARSLLAAAAGMSGGCALCLAPGLSEHAVFPSVTLGMGLAALGTAAIVPCYGTGFRAVGPKATAIYVLAGYIVSGTLSEFLAPQLQVAAVLALPAAMSLLAWLALPSMEAAGMPGAGEGPCAVPARPVPPLPPRVLAVSGVSGFLGMLVQSAMLFAGVEASDGALAPYLVRVAGLALFIAVIAVFGRDYDATSVFWPFAALPVVAASLAPPFIGGALPTVAMALFTMSRHYLSAFTLSLYADLSGRLGRDPGAVFCFGRAADSIGCLAGMVTGYLLAVLAAPTVHFWYVISGVCLCMAVAAFSLMLFNRRFTDPDDAPVQDGAREPGGAPQAPQGPAEAAARLYSLSPREAQVVGYLAKGRSVPFIADEMGVSMSTVKTHMRSLYRKMGVHTRQELLDVVYGEPKG